MRTLELALCFFMALYPDQDQAAPWSSGSHFSPWSGDADVEGGSGDAGGEDSPKVPWRRISGDEDQIPYYQSRALDWEAENEPTRDGGNVAVALDHLVPLLHVGGGEEPQEVESAFVEMEMVYPESSNIRSTSYRGEVASQGLEQVMVEILEEVGHPSSDVQQETSEEVMMEILPEVTMTDSVGLPEVVDTESFAENEFVPMVSPVELTLSKPSEEVVAHNPSVWHFYQSNSETTNDALNPPEVEVPIVEVMVESLNEELEVVAEEAPTGPPAQHQYWGQGQPIFQVHDAVAAPTTEAPSTTIVEVDLEEDAVVEVDLEEDAVSSQLPVLQSSTPPQPHAGQQLTTAAPSAPSPSPPPTSLPTSLPSPPSTASPRGTSDHQQAPTQQASTLYPKEHLTPPAATQPPKRQTTLAPSWYRPRRVTQAPQQRPGNSYRRPLFPTASPRNLNQKRPFLAAPGTWFNLRRHSHTPESFKGSDSAHPRRRHQPLSSFGQRPALDFSEVAKYQNKHLRGRLF